MKRAILPIICLILAVKLLGQIKNNSATTFYYFCVSHAKSSSSKQIILYTIVYQTSDEKNISEKTKAWGSLVDNSCENPGGCTSDLNYYKSKEDAEKQLENTKHLYRNTDQYTIKLVDFK